MKTKTFAEICVQQGELPKAIEIYTALLRRDPKDQALSRRLAELEVQLLEEENPTPPHARKRARLEEILENIRLRKRPPEG